MYKTAFEHHRPAAEKSFSWTTTSQQASPAPRLRILWRSTLLWKEDAMYEYDSLKRYRERILVYKEIPLPIVLCDKNLGVKWANGQARAQFLHLTETEGVRRTLLEFDIPALLEEAVDQGSCILREVIPFTDLSMKITPIMEEGELAGVALILMREGNQLDSCASYKNTRASGAISESIREVVGDMFAILDSAAAKSGRKDTDWLAPRLGELAGNGYRILRVATNIDEYARYQSELLNFRPELICLSAFLREGEETISRLAQAAGVLLKISISRGSLFVRVDLERFEHAFFNILHNALYYTKPGNHVTVSLRAGKTRETATITVTDKGLGIPRAVLSQVTTPYYAHAHRRGIQGVGLGLTIAKLAAQTHDGSLRIRSKEGEGTTVRLTLPLATKSSQAVVLAQGGATFTTKSRFGLARIGLTDTALSPYRE